MAYKYYPLELGDGLGLENNKIIDQGVINVMEILRSRGQVDPRARIRQQEDIAARTQGRVNDISSTFARGGLDNSPLAGALQKAANLGGAQKMLDVLLQSEADAETRRRQDLNFINELFINPKLSLDEIIRQEKQTKAMLDQQRKSAKDSKNLGLLGAAVGIASLFCFPSRAIYGEDAIEPLYVSIYMKELAEPELADQYLLYGPALAEQIKSDESLRMELKPTFDAIVGYTKEYLCGLGDEQ